MVMIVTIVTLGGTGSSFDEQVLQHKQCRKQVDGPVAFEPARRWKRETGVPCDWTGPWRPQ